MTSRPWRSDLTGAVLTGGASRRFGSDKSLASTPTGYLANRPVQAMRDAGIDPVVAVGGTAAAQLGIPVVPDRTPDLGPLSGIASVLVWAKRGHVLVLPCDLPLVTSDLLEPLLVWQETCQPGITGIATVDGAPQPIVAIWPATHGVQLSRLVASGTRRLFDILDEIEWEPIPVGRRLLADADTPDDLERLLGAGPNNQ